MMTINHKNRVRKAGLSNRWGRRKLAFFALVAFSIGGVAPAWAGNYESGVELLMYNKPAEAAPYLERAIIENPGNAAAYYSLAIAQEQLKNYDKAIAALRSAVDRNYGSKTEALARMAKLSLLKGDLDGAVRYNTQAIEADPANVAALLNRANVWFRKPDYEQALADYRQFISVAPDHPLKPDVVRMIQAIEGLKEEQAIAKQREAERLEAARKAEEERLAAEKKRQEEQQAAEAARKAEEERQKAVAEAKRQAEEEQRRLAEAAKRKQLDDLFSSLNEAANEQKNLSAGAEDVQNRQNELTLED